MASTLLALGWSAQRHSVCELRLHRSLTAWHLHANRSPLNANIALSIPHDVVRASAFWLVCLTVCLLEVALRWTQLSSWEPVRQVWNFELSTVFRGRGTIDPDVSLKVFVDCKLTQVILEVTVVHCYCFRHRQDRQTDGRQWMQLCNVFSMHVLCRLIFL